MLKLNLLKCSDKFLDICKRLIGMCKKFVYKQRFKVSWLHELIMFFLPFHMVLGVLSD